MTGERGIRGENGPQGIDGPIGPRGNNLKENVETIPLPFFKKKENLDPLEMTASKEIVEMVVRRVPRVIEA